MSVLSDKAFKIVVSLFGVKLVSAGLNIKRHLLNPFLSYATSPSVLLRSRDFPSSGWRHCSLRVRMCPVK